MSRLVPTSSDGLRPDPPPPSASTRLSAPAAPQPGTAGTLFVEGLPEGFPPVRVAYEQQGAGEPVVLLHGIGHHRRTWDAVGPLLAPERQTIALDLPGFGESPDLLPTAPRDLPTTVAALGAVFAALGTKRPHVAGHSLGGLLALRLAQAGMVRSVTAFAPAGFWNAAERRYAFAILAAARRGARLVPEAAVEGMSRTVVGRVLAGATWSRSDGCTPESVAAGIRALRDAAVFDATLRAGRAPGLFAGDIPDVPVTIAWGTRDWVLLRRQAARLQAMVPGARLVHLDGCGHVPMFDAPDMVARVILEGTNPDGPAFRDPPADGAGRGVA